MDACLITILVIIIIFVIGSILIFTIGRRPTLLCTIPNRDVITFRNEMLNRLTAQPYEIKEKPNGDVFIKKDFFSATTLVLKQNGINVDVSFIHSNCSAFLAVFIVLFILFWIAAIVLAVIADSNSKTFRNNELIPLLGGYGFGIGRMCPSCGRSIPMDALVCPYCARAFT
jgi:hypothetical protein